jgi:hypothetical protein
MTRLERSITDAAVWTKHPRSACGLVIAAVQQRLTQPARLVAELKKAGKVRHRRLLRAVLPTSSVAPRHCPRSTSPACAVDTAYLRRSVKASE